MGRLAQARDQFADAARAAVSEGDGSALAAAALGVGGLWVYEQRGFLERARLHQLWQQAREVVAPGSIAASRLDVRIASEAVYDGGPVEAVQAAVDALAPVGDDRALAEAYSLLHNVQLGPAFAESRLGVAEEVVRFATRCQDQLLSLMGLCWRTVDLYLLADPRADQSLQELRERAEAAGCEAIAFIAHVMEAMRLGRAGRLAEAEAAGVAACQRGTSAGDPDAPAYLAALLGALRWWQGRGSEILDDVREMGMSPRLGSNDHVYIAADACLSASLGDLDGAEEALARLTRMGLAALPRSSSWLTTLFLAGEAAFVLGDPATAADVRELVRPYAGLPVMPSLAVVCLGSAQRTLGLAAATCGDLDAAVEHLDHALNVDRQLGSRPMSALTEHALATILTARRSNDDLDRARILEARSAARAARVGVQLPTAPDWLAHRPVRRHRAALKPLPGGWELTVEGRQTMLSDRVGMRYLATLLSTPGEDHHVLRLMIGVALPSPALSNTQDVLDREAVTSYRSRVKDLRALIASSGTDPDGMVEQRHELESIRSVLRAATGQDGRSRGFPTDQERARTAVRKALVRAIASIRTVEPEMGSYLETTMTTGYTCRYEPRGDWVVSVED
jgi:hypothetical protein